MQVVLDEKTEDGRYRKWLFGRGQCEVIKENGVRCRGRKCFHRHHDGAPNERPGTCHYHGDFSTTERRKKEEWERRRKEEWEEFLRNGRERP